jgi:hypothetical protein
MTTRLAPHSHQSNTHAYQYAPQIRRPVRPRAVPDADACPRSDARGAPPAACGPCPGAWETHRTDGPRLRRRGSSCRPRSTASAICPRRLERSMRRSKHARRPTGTSPTASARTAKLGGRRSPGAGRTASWTSSAGHPSMDRSRDVAAAPRPQVGPRSGPRRGNLARLTPATPAQPRPPRRSSASPGTARASRQALPPMTPTPPARRRSPTRRRRRATPTRNPST